MIKLRNRPKPSEKKNIHHNHVFDNEQNFVHFLFTHCFETSVLELKSSWRSPGDYKITINTFWTFCDKNEEEKL